MFRKPLLLIIAAVTSSVAFAGENQDCKARCEAKMQNPTEVQKCVAECGKAGPQPPIGKPRPKPPLVPSK